SLQRQARGRQNGATSDVLRNGQRVAVGVFEPGDLRAAGCGPDAELVLRPHVVVALKNDPASGHVADILLDLRGLPTKNREGRRCKRTGASNADHVFPGLKEDCELVFRDKAQPHLLLVEGACSIAVARWNEPHENAGRGHLGLLSGMRSLLTLYLSCCVTSR